MTTCMHACSIAITVIGWLKQPVVGYLESTGHWAIPDAVTVANLKVASYVASK